MSWIITGTQKEPPSPYLLDTFPAAAAAYSLRQLRTGNTNVVRVRRDNDDAEDDFTATEVSDGTLAAWVGAGNDGFVRTWYDQSGSNKNAAQSDPARQPLIVQNGSYLLDGIKFDATDDYLDCGAILWSATGAQSTFVIAKHATGSETQPTNFIGTYSSGVSGRTWLSANSAGFTFFSNGTSNVLTTFTPLTNLRVLFSVTQPTSNSVTARLNNLTLTSTGSGVSRYQRNTFIGGGTGSNENTLNGFISEIIVYPSDQSANRVGIEANINAHYNIFS